MNHIAIIYWSGTGNTEAMANAVLAGAKSAGAEGYRQLADEVIERGVRDWYTEF